MRLPLYRIIGIVLILFLKLHLSFSMHNKYINVISKWKIIEKQAQCIKITAENLFITLDHLYVICEEQCVNQRIYSVLYKHYSLITGRTAIFEGNVVKTYIIIGRKLSEMENLFEKPVFSKWSQYLIVAKLSFEELSKLSQYLFELEFFYVGFLWIDENENVTIYQFNENNRNGEKDIMVPMANCDDNFLLNDNSRKYLRSFQKGFFSGKRRTLSFWKPILDTPNSLIYEWDYVNGQMTKTPHSPAGKMLIEFARRNNIQIENNLMESLVEISWTEAAKAAENGTVDVIYGWSLPNSEIFQSISVCTFYGLQKLNMMYVPEIYYDFNALKNLFSPLEPEVWLCSVIIVVFYGLFMYLVKKSYKQKLIREHLNPCDLIRIFMKQPISQPENGGLRIVMGIMLIFGLLVTIAYESTITSSFFPKSYEKPLRNIPDLLKSDRPFGGPSFIRQFFTNFSDPVEKNFSDRYEGMKLADGEEHLKRMKIVILHTNRFINLMKWFNRYKYSYQVPKEPFFIYPTMFFMRKEHPYKYPLRSFCMRLLDFGIAEKMRNDNVTRFQHKKSDDQSFIILKNEHLSFCWFLIFHGWILSFMCFIGENIIYRFMKEK